MGMQSMPRTQIFDHRQTILAQSLAFIFAIKRIANHPMANPGKMDPDLMGSAGFQLAKQFAGKRRMQAAKYAGNLKIGMGIATLA